ncbi:MAG: DUF5110 domain-containing protein, partial [Actinobacteria bacterium]|nr:DUF5110 domain-containing protein [Actinomycetota bacterium]
MFLPVTMTMDGWADTDKQPWCHGEPYTSINRRYIQLRERLLPYFYTYAAQAHRHGVGMVRPLVLEYPDDPTVLREEAKYEFLAGEAFLVAPVFDDQSVRDGIYLPAGTWFDYWTGEQYRGPIRLHDHPAPLDRLPLFVKGGSIIPMWPEGTLSWMTRDTGRLDLDIYPDGDSTFTLYEDDGVSRRYAEGEYAEQTFAVTDSTEGLHITIGECRGRYTGQPSDRRYLLRIHRRQPPTTVTAHEIPLEWHHDPDLGGVFELRTPPIPIGTPITITVR